MNFVERSSTRVAEGVMGNIVSLRNRKLCVVKLGDYVEK
jgi:hypothetical protein